jgi:D-alanyl-D-alanine carboxypeptidase
MMFRYKWALLWAAGCSPLDETAPSAEPIAATELGEDFDAALLEALEASHAASDAPGASAAVWIHGMGSWSAGAGYADLDNQIAVDADHSFRVGSITKTMTAAAVMHLVENGVLDLDVAVSTYLDVAFGDVVSLRQCLNHTAGYADYVETPAYLGAANRAVEPMELIGFVDEALDFEPGTRWDYSSTGFLVAGLVVEEVTGQDYATYVRENLLVPAGAEGVVLPTQDGGLPTAHGYFVGNDVTDAVDPTGLWAAGEAIASPSDLVVWARALYGAEVLSSGTVEQMVSPTVLADGRQIKYGLGTELVSLDGATVGHGGALTGYDARVRRLDFDGTVVVISTTVNDYYEEADDVEQVLLEVLSGRLGGM